MRGIILPVLIKMYQKEPIMKRFLVLEKYFLVHMSLRLSDVSKCKAVVV